ncbi:MAG: NirD/YgiW/YdeI family stress tolerance protein [Spirochaetia bacterium]
MKKFVVLLIFSLSMTLVGQPTAKEVKINYVKTKSSGYDAVIIEGKVVQQIDSDEFILQDETGSIKMELEGALEYEYRTGLVGATIRVYAIVDKDGPWDNAELKAMKIRIITAGNGSGIPDNF